MRVRTGIFQRVRQRLGGSKTVELPISCYGKLPLYKDFLRENLAGKEAQAFKRWLDKGVSHYWGTRDGYRGTTIYPHGVLFRFPGTAKYLLGYLWGSHDEGGLRFFPFSLFASIPAGRESFPPHSVLQALDAVMTAGAQWRQEAARLTSVQEFKRWSRGLKLEVTIQPEHEVVSEILGKASTITIGQFATGLWDEQSDLEWPLLLSYLERHRSRIKARNHNVDLAARFPTSGQLPMILQTQYWTQIIEHYDHRRERPVQLLVPAYDGRAGITIVLRNLRPDDVFAFHPEMPMNEFIEDFRTSVPRSRETTEPLSQTEKDRPLCALLDDGFSKDHGDSDHGH
jgi:type VI secretion system ImpM family protein